MDLVSIIVNLFIWFLLLACPILLFPAIYFILHYRFKARDRTWNVIITLLIFSVIFLSLPVFSGDIIISFLFGPFAFPSLLFLATYLTLYCIFKVRNSILNSSIALVVSMGVLLSLLWILEDVVGVHLLFFPWTDCQVYGSNWLPESHVRDVADNRLALGPVSLAPLICRLVQAGEHLAIVIAALVIVVLLIVEKIKKFREKS